MEDAGRASVGMQVRGPVRRRRLEPRPTIVQRASGARPPFFLEIDILMTNWDVRFLKLAKNIASWSKDPSTQVGCVIVGCDRAHNFVRWQVSHGNLIDS